MERSGWGGCPAPRDCFSLALTGWVSWVGFPVLTWGLVQGQRWGMWAECWIADFTAVSEYVSWKSLWNYGLRLHSRQTFPGNVALIWWGGRLICGPFCLKREFSFAGSQCLHLLKGKIVKKIRQKGLISNLEKTYVIWSFFRLIFLNLPCFETGQSILVDFCLAILGTILIVFNNKEKPAQLPRISKGWPEPKLLI